VGQFILACPESFFKAIIFKIKIPEYCMPQNNYLEIISESGDDSVFSHSFKQKQPEITVIVTCYNYGQYLTEAVNSVLNQSYKNFELVIVNDGSTDNSKEIASQIIAANPELAIILVNMKNSGQPAISRNKGISMSRGKFILCLDADDMIDPEMLNECFNILENNPDISIVYTDTLYLLKNSQQVVKSRTYSALLLKDFNFIPYCSMFKQEIWKKTGGYRENVKGMEDWDFWIAASANNFKGFYLEKPLFFYRKHDEGVFQTALKDFSKTYAKIVLNNRELYSISRIKNAEKILSAEIIKAPLVSVIIPTFNRPEALIRAVNSVLNQKFQDFEIIIINDGGTDVSESLGFCKNRLVYLNNSANFGVAASRNLGLTIARGKYIAYLNDNDLYYPNHLEDSVNYLENSNYKVVYSGSCQLIEDVSGEESFIAGKKPVNSDIVDKQEIFIYNSVPLLSIVHEKSCLAETGFFDQELFFNEEWDLIIRLSRKYDFANLKQINSEFNYKLTYDAVNMYSLISETIYIYNKYRDKLSNIDIEKQKNYLKTTYVDYILNEVFSGLFERALVEYNQENYKKSEELFLLIKNYHDNIYAGYYLAKIRFMAEDYLTALGLLENCRNIEDASVLFAETKSIIFEKANKLIEAENYPEAELYFLQINSLENDEKYENYLGLIKMKLGKYEEAIQHFSRCINKKTADHSLFFNMATSLEKIGNHDIAGKYFAMAKKMSG
jgi:glycosyltransferase involved in cell wall biosynthesis